MQSALALRNFLKYNGKECSMLSSYYKKIVMVQCVENTWLVPEYPYIDEKMQNLRIDRMILRRMNMYNSPEELLSVCTNLFCFIRDVATKIQRY